MNTRAANAGLWASALVLAALTALQARNLTGNAARADLVSRAGEFTMLTADVGTDDLLVVLDNRSEQLLVYRVRAQKSLELLQNTSVSRLFESARQTTGR